jgi:magnesium transporter
MIKETTFGQDRLPPLHELQFETAREHYTTSVPTASPHDRVGRIRRELIGQRYDTVAEIVVCDEHRRLLGLVNIEDLMGADDETRLNAIMDPSPPAVTQGVDQEHVAWLAIRRGETSLAVVDDNERFLGLITPRRIFEVLLFEHHEDTDRLGGFLRTSAEALATSDEPLVRRMRHRLPWLLLGLLGALLSADVVGAFEAQLQTQIMLAFFIPGIVYLADAVGTQTETLVIRGMSLGISVEKMFWREVVTGVLMGLVLALILFPLVLFRWRNPDLALAVSAAVLAACSTASVVAMVLPWALRALRQDPAFAAGPLATVIQDVLTVLVYFVVCLAVV